VGLKDKIRKLEKAVGGNRIAFELVDGTRFVFDPAEVGPAMFAYFAASARAVYRGEERPDPPEIIRAMARARDREAAFRQVFPESLAHSPLFDQDALVERGEIVPRPIVPSEILA